jgi:radical SAM protein with 4Fe4S-binding SPASM domain
MFCYHKPPPELLDSLATYGCQAGNVLWGMRSDGTVSGCSFLKSTGSSVFDLSSKKSREECFKDITTWPDRSPQPCKSCDYLDICRGGCRAVSQSVTGDIDSADPDCPFVVEYNNKLKTDR